MSDTDPAPDPDAWKQMDDLRRKFTREYVVRSDLEVVALACSRNVRLVMGKSPLFTGPDKREQYFVTDRNVSTVREFAQAILDACDFVEDANPKWAAHPSHDPHRMAGSFMSEIRDISPERLGVEMADVAYVRTKAQLADVLDVLDQLTDVTFILIHLVMKGYRTDDQVAVTRLILEDAVQVLRDHKVWPVTYGCEKCGSRDPETSHWHANNCTKETDHDT